MPGSGGVVAISKADKANEYVGYAKHCLKIAEALPEHESRILLREMAAEWMKLAQVTAEDASLGASKLSRKSTARARS